MDLTHLYFLSEIGGKTNQEDYIWPTPGLASLHDKVFIVCDGVGGAANGEVASRIIAESVGQGILKLEKKEMSGATVNDLLSEARQRLVAHAQENGLNSDMATTFTLLVLSDRKVFAAWCGDSRIYHIRHGEILYKTSDHSLVNSLVKSGDITEEEALTHPRKNVILRAIKADDSPIEADYHFIEDVHDGDYFMLCTDGLLENITDKDLKFLITQNDKGNIDLIEAFQQFCLGKTRDNYSMYLMKVRLDPVPKVYKRKILRLAIFLVLLVCATALIIVQYFSKKQQPAEPSAIVQNTADTTKQSAPDPVVLTQKEMPPVNTGQTKPADSSVAKTQVKDSSLSKTEPAKKIKSKPKLNFIDSPTAPVTEKPKQGAIQNVPVEKKDSM